MEDNPEATIGFEHPLASDGYAEIVVDVDGIDHHPQEGTLVVEIDDVIECDIEEIFEGYDMIHLTRERVTHISHEAFGWY